RLETGDIVRAAQRHYQSGMLRGAMFWLAFSLLVVVAFALGILGDARHSLTIVLLPILWGTVVVTHILVYFVLIPRGCRRHYATYRRLQLPHQYEFDNAGLRFKDELGQNLMPWDHIHKWIETESLFLLYPTRSLYHILPKRALGQD